MKGVDMVDCPYQHKCIQVNSLFCETCKHNQVKDYYKKEKKK